MIETQSSERATGKWSEITRFYEVWKNLTDPLTKDLCRKMVFDTSGGWD